jgi:ferric-dicitrate binding protein FerR (iron transport regulator)
VSLLEAVDEMNRFDRVPIVVTSAALTERRVSGVFKTGNNASVDAVARLYGLVVRNHGDRLELVPQ